MAPKTAPRLLRSIRLLEQQLEVLHHSRKKRLDKLTRRRDNLLAQLARVDQDLSVLGDVEPVSEPAEAAVESAQPVIPRKKRGRRPLRDVIIGILQDVGRAMTVAQMASQARERGYPTRSGKFSKAVETRVQEMKRNGLIKKAEGERGYVLVDGVSTETLNPPDANGVVKGGKRKKKRRNATSLRIVVTGVLNSSDRPLTAQEIADRVRATGYKSKSKNLKNVVWVTLKKVEGIQSMPDNTWAIKK